MLTFESQLESKVPDLKVAVVKVAVERVEDSNPKLEELKKAVINEVRSKYSLESLKDVRIFRCYRDFFWRLGIDPTKVRPASEALVRRILQGGSIPTINAAVDAINLSSIQTEIVIDAFDTAKISGEIRIKFASQGERFLGIGMKHELVLRGGEMVISDALSPIAIYPHRDASRTAVTRQTEEILTVMCGVPGIEGKELLSAALVVASTIVRFCGGKQTSQAIVLPR
nr:phenylalanine--tRNA ligase beta subunit-related protein [Candidatus Njordarchaeum guaymaensis]